MIGKSSNINDLARVLTTKGYAIKKISLDREDDMAKFKVIGLN